MFIDRARIRVIAGSGGSGACSFARFKFKPRGGPDGGDGGRGGSVYVRGDGNLTTLLDYRYRATWKAERGQHGKGKKMTGKSGEDLHLPVPPGTVIRDIDTGQTIGEVLRDGDELAIARGGKGGRGNVRFTTSTHQAPREWEPGGVGEVRSVELVLKLIADVGLVGEPNAGKSTLLSVISAARPRIADYPFTTLAPNLGVVGLSGHRSFVVADIPGIIEGAHAGKGLGLTFLQHIERTRILVMLLPLDDPSSDLQAVYERLRTEIRAYSDRLANTPHLVVLTKSDLLAEDDAPPRLRADEATDVCVISSLSGKGVAELLERLWAALKEVRQAESPEVEPWLRVHPESAAPHDGGD